LLGASEITDELGIMYNNVIVTPNTAKFFELKLKVEGNNYLRKYSFSGDKEESVTYMYANNNVTITVAGKGISTTHDGALVLIQPKTSR
jgi:hypothetical protein